MNSKVCNPFRDQIARSFLEDLSLEEDEALRKHLEECGPCAQEREAYRETIHHLRQTEDVETPRHFFVYADQQVQPGLWSVFKSWSPVWQSAAAVLAIALIGTTVMAFSRLQVRVENGVYSFSFGNLPAPVEPAPPIDLYALEARILQIAEKQAQGQALEWIRTLRSEIERSERVVASRQRQSMQQSLAQLEERIENRLLQTAESLESQRARAIGEVYRAVTYQREVDLAEVNARINRLAVNDEIKSNQTDAILETLLQVAELRLK